MVRNYTCIGVIIATLLVMGRPLSANAPPRDVVGDNYRKTLGEVWATVKQRFYDGGLHGLDWDRVRDNYLDLLNDVHSRPDFEALVNRMLGELHASHTEYATTDDVEYYMLMAVKDQDPRRYMIAQIGIMGRRESDGYHVTALLNGGPAAMAGVQSGDVLMSADGAPYLSAASLRDKEGRRVAVTLRRPGELAPRTVMVTPIKQNPLDAFLRATINSARVLAVDGRRIGYVHLWTMASDNFRQALDNLVLDKLHDTDGMILDLRDGYGGSPFGFSDVFFRPDLSWEVRYNDTQPHLTHTGYNKPMVVLIDGGTRSAKEFLTLQFKTSHRATIVGTRTAGAFLGAAFIPIGTDGVLELAIQGLRVNGARLENRGVDPDIAVPPTDIYTDRDAQLMRSEEIVAHAPLPVEPDHHDSSVIHVH